jgi:hypothetical protein
MYSLCLSKSFASEGVGSSTHLPEVLGGRGSNKWWRIWKLPCSNKVKHFWWRCAHNSLATRDNLIRRGVKVDDPKCLFCNREYEDGFHLFVKCREVKPLWRELGYENMRVKMDNCSSIEGVMDVIWKLQETQKLQITTM